MDKEKRKLAFKYVKKSFFELFSTYALTKLIFFSGVIFLGGFIIDYENIPGKIIEQVPVAIVYSVSIVALVILIAWIVEAHVIDLFRIHSVNFVDAAAFVFFFSGLAYAIVRKVVIGEGLYVSIAFALCVVALLIFADRFLRRCKELYKADTKRSNLIDLQELFENRFVKIPGKPVLLLEKAVDYDLLDRGEITNQLYRSIIHCLPSQSYVISLEGEWGSGKTTIINHTKRLLREKEITNKEYVCIGDFDPWLYETQDALLMGMLESLIHHSGLHYSPSRFNGIVKELRETISNSHWSSSFLQSLFSHSVKPGSSVTILKQRISRYLRSRNKTIVFFIDNFDRANDDNVIFLFKLIAIVFDLPGIIYVLSFERERINTILRDTHHLDPHFKEKIIQQEITVPTVSKEKAMNLYSTCIANLLEAYGVPQNEIREFTHVANYIVEKTRTIRMFKRMVNSVFPLVFDHDTLLKTRDLLAIEAIRFYDLELFGTIYNNPKYFISHEKNSADVWKIGFNTKKFNEDGAEFFKTLFSKHGDSLELLCELFPYVKRYESGAVLESEHSFYDPEFEQISKQSRICSGKYFDLYFSYSTNNYITIRKSIEDMVSDLNKMQRSRVSSALVETSKIVKTYMSEIESSDHKEWVERLQRHLSDINVEVQLPVAVSLYELIYDLDDSSMFGSGLSARARAEYIISLLLEKCSESDFEEFLRISKGDFYRLRVINSIYYWMSSEKRDQSEVRNARAALILSHYTEMCNQIIDGNINLYSDAFYHSKNVWGLYHYYKQCENTAKFNKYIGNHISGENIYRVLWDITTVSMSDQYTYSINDDNFGVFINSIELVDQLIQSRIPKNKDEEFVHQIYEKFRNGTPNIWGEKGVTIPTYKELQL